MEAPDDDVPVENLAHPLLEPAGGTPQIISTDAQLTDALVQLESGVGPFAVDAERASGYKYNPRAYLIQVKRTNGGLHLIDPVAFNHPHALFDRLNNILATDEVILHASTQDLPCLRDVGLNPTRLFDTELGGRIAGLPRVGLGPLVETQLGFSLAKEHSAVDWSTRPLPHEWLTYAALDVELLVELREKISASLESQGKLDWAREEFAAIVNAPPSPARKDPWRRTSGMHKIKKRNQLAIIKSLWHVRDDLARESDIAPGKLLSDAAILELAVGAPTNRKEMEKVLRPIGMRARWFENTDAWLRAITDGVALPEDQWPESRAATDALPPVKIWRDKFPTKYAHLSHARARVDEQAQKLSIPSENLISPEFVRRICWNAPANVSEALAALGARPWQIAIVTPELTKALLEKQPLPTPPEVDESASSGQV
ncbi:unannotated protein [freshwater metagenome]|uniref:Unannotated protein n=1 Tax=freshwater metagenome TaxID=449393 RepID=A0A6J7JLA2_9ZZZZ|nr:HRDC domain-containing protein [Actinomycetota bacterium]MSV63990.1 ribonuclease D [Actinomycetota bacterium]MSW25828.1 ribonuclease D [Actinomycetota bacterium]MSW34120.1 ribonuclease D [Actinomycetota bacterium]MSX30682.1 ribonuclease D [Actinomycetota bacterium]